MFGEQGTEQSGEFGPMSPARVADWGLDGQEMNHHLLLRFNAAPQVPSQAGVPKFHLRNYKLPR